MWVGRDIFFYADICFIFWKCWKKLTCFYSLQHQSTSLSSPRQAGSPVFFFTYRLESIFTISSLPVVWAPKMERPLLLETPFTEHLKMSLGWQPYTILRGQYSPLVCPCSECSSHNRRCRFHLLADACPPHIAKTHLPPKAPDKQTRASWEVGTCENSCLFCWLCHSQCVYSD